LGESHGSAKIRGRLATICVGSGVQDREQPHPGGRPGGCVRFAEDRPARA
jgi:hypothetical protein